MEENISIYGMLKGSGYFELHNKIKEVDIIEQLSRNLGCIEDWLIFSEKKRTNSGCFFNVNSDNKFIEGNLSLKLNQEITEYFDKIQACSLFIKREIEDIRLS